MGDDAGEIGEGELATDEEFERDVEPERTFEMTTSGSPHLEQEEFPEVLAGVDPEVRYRSDAGTADARATTAAPTRSFDATATTRSGGWPTRRRGSRRTSPPPTPTQVELSEVDDVFGPLTEGSVAHFQQRDGLAVNGVIDGATWEAPDVEPSGRTPEATTPGPAPPPTRPSRSS